MTNQKDIQEKLLRYQMLENQIKALNQRRELLLSKILEMESTLNSIQEIKKSKGDEILLPIGSNVHVPGSLKKIQKMIVELGSNIAIETTPEKTKEILDKRKIILEDGLKTVEQQLMMISQELMRLEPEIQAMIQKSRTTTQPAG